MAAPEIFFVKAGIRCAIELENLVTEVFKDTAYHAVPTDVQLDTDGSLIVRDVCEVVYRCASFVKPDAFRNSLKICVR